MMAPSPSLLYLCSGKGHLAVMAVALTRQMYPHAPAVCGASPEYREDADGLLAGVMAEVGIPGVEPCRLLREVEPRDFDVVVTIGPETEGLAPSLLPGQPCRISWKMDLLGTFPPEDRQRAYRHARDDLRNRITHLLDGGYIEAIRQESLKINLLLDHLHEGIIVHDIQQRITFFNRAAELLTGMARKEVLGRRCTDLFGRRLCGEECHFQSHPPAERGSAPVTREYTNADGTPHVFEVTVQNIADPDGAVHGAFALFRDVTRERTLARRLGEQEHFSGIIGRDKTMLEVFDLIRSVADSNAPVLIQGESGTGKELVAAAIHNESHRAEKAFVPVNCGALPESLLESELFGHVRGAFTGAVRDKKGRFELADGGTIFLDEIGDISVPMQVKLLRVLQEGTFEPVGGTRTCRVNVRVISATNKDLAEEIEAGRFREDLFYRLCVVPIHLPPLRQRCGDIPLIVREIVRRVAVEEGKDGVVLSGGALDALLAYPWPGNVRELHNAIQFAIVKCRGPRIERHDLPPAIATPPGAESRAAALLSVPPDLDGYAPVPWFQPGRPVHEPALSPGSLTESRPGSAAVSGVPAPDPYAGETGTKATARPGVTPPATRADGKPRRRHKLDGVDLVAVFREAGGNKVEAARRLGVSRATLYRYLEEQGLSL